MVKRIINQKLREILTPRKSKLRQGQLLRVARNKVVLKEETGIAISGKQKGSVREEINADPGKTVMSLRKRHQKPLPPSPHRSTHQHQVLVRREKAASMAGVRLGWPIDSRSKIFYDQSTAVQKLLERYLH